MISKRLAIPIAVTVLILFTLIPACALAAGGSISGKVAIPPNATLPEYINVTVDQNQVVHTEITKTIDASYLTIMAYNTKTGFVNRTSPAVDGTYTIQLPENGVYKIQVWPTEIVDLMNPSVRTMAQYPNWQDRLYQVTVNGDMKNVDINYYPPGEYVQPTDVPNNTSESTPTAKPTPGFAVIAVLAGLLGAFAIVSRNK